MGHFFSLSTQRRVHFPIAFTLVGSLNAFTTGPQVGEVEHENLSLAGPTTVWRERPEFYRFHNKSVRFQRHLLFQTILQ